MQINDKAAKFDQQLDVACKKYEKICIDCDATPEKDFLIKDQNEQNITYMQYIKNFEWNNRKYNQKLPLSELIDAFMKTLQQNDAMIKKFTDELNMKKAKRAMLAKKEGGNLLTRDYIDDIYNSTQLKQDDFIEGKGS